MKVGKKADESGWRCMKVGASGWKWWTRTGWKRMKEGEGGRKRIQKSASGWKLLKVDELWWNWMKEDKKENETRWKWIKENFFFIKVDETERKLIKSWWKGMKAGKVKESWWKWIKVDDSGW